MAKNKPKLTLIDREGTSPYARGLSVSDGFDFTAVAELGATERKRVSKLLAEICPRAGVIAVARTARTWDVRPVVVLSDEDGPSIIRSAGPDISLHPDIVARVRESFERMTRYPDVSSGMRAWGEFEGQLWFRRGLVSSTLAHMFSGEIALDLDRGLALGQMLADEIANWHSHGLIHGHITSANIFISASGEIVLLDAAVGAALAQTSQEASSQVSQSLAPEVSRDGEITYSADVYGYGQVLRRLLLALRKKYQFANDKTQVYERLDPYQQFTNRLVEKDPEHRPTLADVLSFLAEQRQQHADNGKSKNKAATPVSGKIIKTAATPITAAPVWEHEEHDAFGADRLHDLEFEESEPLPQQFAEPKPSRRAPQEGYSGGADAQTTIYKMMSKSKQQPAPKSQSRRANDELDPFAGEYTLPEDELDFTEHDADDLFVFDHEAVTAKAPKSKQAKATGKYPAVQADSSSAKGFWIYVGLLCAVLAGIYYYMKVMDHGLQTMEFSLPELKADWDSRIPSRMLTVAEVAVDTNVDNKEVQDIIVSSAKNGDALPSVIDIGLLRIAFNDKWEMELSREDRRMAVAFSLVSLLRERMPTNLGPLDQRHPGVILAITASAGRNVSKFLSPIPAEVLARLPQPFGAAFQRLVEAQPGLNCADEAVELLSKFGTREVKAQELPAYLSKDVSVRLQALALIASHQDVAAKGILDVLLNHPNIVLDIPEVTWGRTWDVLNWTELESADKLFVVSGIQPSARVSAENVAKMFTHPSPELRAFAIEQALDRIKFDHPAAFSILKRIQQRPSALSPEQLFRLAELLQAPQKAKQIRVEEWLATEPPVELVGEMLVSTASAKEPLPLDTWFAIYLKKKDWSPDVVTLRKLSMHPDRYTRLYIYTLIHRMKDEETAKLFLQTALTKESDPNYRKQLQLMISQLGVHAAESAAADATLPAAQPVVSPAEQPEAALAPEPVEPEAATTTSPSPAPGVPVPIAKATLVAPQQPVNARAIAEDAAFEEVTGGE